MQESNIQAEIMLSVGSDPETKIFRNNTGTGWTGSKMIRKGNIMIIENPRPLNAGLCVGSSDIIGFKTISITPEMIGKKIAVFTAIETKTLKGRVSPEQEKFIRIVKNAGGFAGVARSKDEALKIVA